ncbi:fumarylacetoacetate hydrolase family protein [Actinomadura scrupuli]|uniref:fumarylacetoacetate hydrolase family protein n=1 Tax=Actinomadura scrupuli TaxID=559629 RepID=UPI003D97F489
MRLATIRLDGRTAAARIDDDIATLLDHADVGELLADPDWRARAAGPGQTRTVAPADYATLIPRPEKIICLGLNYRTHIAEMGRDTPRYPTLFAKYSGALIGGHDDIVLPVVSRDVDWEAELGVVIGRPGRHIRHEDALAHVAGYTVVNDVTVRDYQHRTREFLSGKTFEHTTPVGPVLVTAEEFGDAEPDLEMVCAVDGEVMQRARTSDLLFGVRDIISYVSDIITLRPGDLIATGTPGGVGAGRSPKVFLTEGQVLTTSIERLGTQRNVCVPEKV